MNDAKAMVIIVPAGRFRDLAGFFPFVGEGRDMRVDVVADVGAQVVVQVCVVGVFDVELREERFAVGSGWEAGGGRHFGGN